MGDRVIASGGFPFYTARHASREMRRHIFYHHATPSGLGLILTQKACTASCYKLFYSTITHVILTSFCLTRLKCHISLRDCKFAWKQGFIL
jgi:hypothetical protein